MIYLGNDVVFEEFSLHFHGAKVVKQILVFGFSDADPKSRSHFLHLHYEHGASSGPTPAN